MCRWQSQVSFLGAIHLSVETSSPVGMELAKSFSLVGQQLRFLPICLYSENYYAQFFVCLFYFFKVDSENGTHIFMLLWQHLLISCSRPGCTFLNLCYACLKRKLRVTWECFSKSYIHLRCCLSETSMLNSTRLHIGK